MAVYIQPGLIAPKTGGLYDLPTKLRDHYPDENRVWIQVLPHHANNRQIARYINFRKPRRKVHIGHSLGVGEGLKEYADELDLLGDGIDLSVAIDPVPQFDELGSLFRTERPFAMPSNVKKVFTARTLNKRFLSPWGRRIEDSRVIQRIVFQRDLVPSNGVTLNIADPKVTHANIDENPILQEAVVRAILDLESQ